MSKQPIPDEYLRAIGRVTIKFSILELKLAFCVGELIGCTQRIGQLITAKRYFSQLILLLNSIYRERMSDPDKQEELARLLDRAKELSEKRNDIMHAAWSVDAQPPHDTIRFKIRNTKKGPDCELESIKLEDLDNTANLIEEIGFEITAFLSPLFKNVK